MKFSSTIVCLGLVAGLVSCMNENQRNPAVPAQEANAESGELGLPLDDENFNSMLEAENLSKLLGPDYRGVEDDGMQSDKDSEEEADDDEKAPRDEVVSEACKWNDPANLDFSANISGLPKDFEVSLRNDFISNKLGRYEGRFGNRDYIVSFLLFHDKQNIEKSSKIQFKDKKGLYASFYTIAVKNYDKPNCKAFADGKLDERRKKGGCFALGTEITMADGSKKPIAVVNAGDMIRNPVTGKSMEVGSVVSGPEADKPMYTIGYGKNEVVVTQSHPFATKVGVKAAMHLRVGEKVLSADGSYKALTKVEKMALNPSQYVKNLTIKGAKTTIDHMVEADGVVTGDLYLQRQINNKLNAAN